MDNWLIGFGSTPAQSYKGILMRANPKLHAEAFAILSGYLQPGAEVIDVGAGQGAFSLRMSDAGIKVLAIDVNKDDFKASGIDYRAVDFNKSYEIDALKLDLFGKFDASIGMEVIEHVENPWDYIRLLKGFVKPGGLVFITTPNIESTYSKLDFLFSSKHAHFRIGDYHGSGHINPLTELELRIIAEAENLEVIEIRSICSLPKIWITRNIPYLFYSVINTLFGWSFGKNANGDILCLVAKVPA
jgi:2-polyprenyl-3-methyl-5-hydroxy-6-metoxy-1,4-benzoquinol methylase